MSPIGTVVSGFISRKGKIRYLIMMISSLFQTAAENIILSRAGLFCSFLPLATLHQACQCTTRPFTISRGLLKLMSIESVMPSNHLILCHPLLLLPSIFPSIRVFSNESAFCIRWPKYWSFSFNISPSNEHLGLISFRMDGLVGSP